MNRTPPSAELAPTSTEPPDFLVPGLPYSAAELWAMERSGLVVHLAGDLYLPARHPGVEGVSTGRTAQSVRLRAAATHRLAAPVVFGRWAAMGLSAAWVHAGGPAPAVLEVAVEHFHRTPLSPLAVRWAPEQTDAVRHPEDVLDLAGLPCTAPARTIEDLLRRVDDPERAPSAVAAAALLVPLLPVEQLLERFERNRRRPGMAAARRVLAELLTPGQEADVPPEFRPAVRYTS